MRMEAMDTVVSYDRPLSGQGLKDAFGKGSAMRFGTVLPPRCYVIFVLLMDVFGSDRYCN
jgi:hypothetical protein